MKEEYVYWKMKLPRKIWLIRTASKKEKKEIPQIGYPPNSCFHHCFGKSVKNMVATKNSILLKDYKTTIFVKKTFEYTGVSKCFCSHILAMITVTDDPIGFKRFIGCKKSRRSVIRYRFHRSLTIAASIRLREFFRTLLYQNCSLGRDKINNKCYTRVSNGCWENANVQAKIISISSGAFILLDIFYKQL